MYIRLIYVSQVVGNLGMEITSILNQCEKNNPQNELTGMLCTNGASFLQWLEGPREKVSETYERIVKDPRHKRAVLIEAIEVDTRKFGGWNMAYLGASEDSLAILKEFGSVKADFSDLSAAAAYDFMINISKNLSSQSTPV